MFRQLGFHPFLFALSFFFFGAISLQAEILTQTIHIGNAIGRMSELREQRLRQLGEQRAEIANDRSLTPAERDQRLREIDAQRAGLTANEASAQQAQAANNARGKHATKGDDKGVVPPPPPPPPAKKEEEKKEEKKAESKKEEPLKFQDSTALMELANTKEAEAKVDLTPPKAAAADLGQARSSAKSAQAEKLVLENEVAKIGELTDFYKFAMKQTDALKGNLNKGLPHAHTPGATAKAAAPQPTLADSIKNFQSTGTVAARTGSTNASTTGSGAAARLMGNLKGEPTDMGRSIASSQEEEENEDETETVKALKAKRKKNPLSRGKRFYRPSPP